MTLEHFRGRETLISQALLKFEAVYRFPDEKNPLRLTRRATEPIWCYGNDLKIQKGTIFLITDLTPNDADTGRNFLLHVAFPMEEPNKDGLIRYTVPCTIDPDTFDILVNGKANLADITTGVNNTIAADVISLYESQLAYDIGEREHSSYGSCLAFAIFMLLLLTMMTARCLRTIEPDKLLWGVFLEILCVCSVAVTAALYIRHKRCSYETSNEGRRQLRQITKFRQRLNSH